MGVRSSWLFGTLLHWQPTVLTPKSWMPKFSENKPIHDCHWYWLKWTEFILKVVHHNYSFIYVECIHVYISLSYCYLLFWFCLICKCTHLPTARQCNVLFLPSTAVSVAAGISLHEGALCFCGSVWPKTKYTILCKIILNPCFML